jgi:hypothetical protein
MARRRLFRKTTNTRIGVMARPWLRPIVAATVIAAAVFGLLPALAEEIKGVYTTFDAEKCKHEPGTEEEDYGSWECKGHGDFPVLLAAGDQRMYVSFGKKGGDDDRRAPLRDNPSLERHDRQG